MARLWILLEFGEKGVYTSYTRLTEKCFEPGYLNFEAGPSQIVCLQWARYFDAADQSARSRLAGGIHPIFHDAFIQVP